MLGLVAPHDDSEERRLLFPPTRHRHPEHGPGDAGLGVADLRLVGEVAGEADVGLGRLDLLRCTAQVVEAAVEVSRLEWGPVKTHEARTVRLPRSVAEEVAASLAGRPQDREALVFTAPMVGR
jgi:hypothetical protein